MTFINRLVEQGRSSNLKWGLKSHLWMDFALLSPKTPSVRKCATPDLLFNVHFTSIGDEVVEAMTFS